MEQELEKSLSKIRRNIISSKVGNFWCFPVVADGNLVKGEDFPGARRALNGKIFRLLLNYRQQLRENHQKFPPISSAILEIVIISSSSSIISYEKNLRDDACAR